jgi:hypothetical protein
MPAVNPKKTIENNYVAAQERVLLLLILRLLLLFFLKLFINSDFLIFETKQNNISFFSS